MMREFVNHQTDRSKLQVFAIGDKGTVGLQRPMPDLVKVAISDLSRPINYPTVMAVSEHIMKAADSTDKILVFYNEFKSAI